TGIHFHEIEIPVFVNQKFYCSHAFIIHRSSSFYSSLAHFFTKGFGHKRAGRFFHKFLVSTLDRAIPLAHMAKSTKLISGNLNFNMAWFFDKLLHIYAIVSKGGLSLAL